MLSKLEDKVISQSIAGDSEANTTMNPRHNLSTTNNQSTPPDSDTEKPVKPSWPGGDAPDGGLRAWLMVLGTWCVAFCSFGWLNSVGVFQEYYQNDLLNNYSASTISWIPSLQIFLMMALGPLVGAIYDKYGPRALLLGGSILHVFGLMMASLGTEYYQILLAQGVCSAIGVSAIFQAATNSLHGWFNKKRGAAFGIYATGSSMGGVIFPIMVTHLISSVGYAWAMRISAFLILFLLTVANLTVRAFHPPHPQHISPAQLVKPFTEPAFMLLVAGFFCFTYGVFIPIDYLQVQAFEVGMNPSLVEYLIPILNAASLFGRLFSGFMGDRIGRYNIFIIVCALSGVWILGLWIPDSSTPALIAFSVLFGFCSGAYVSLIAPLIMQISPMSEIGFRTGLVFLCSSVGGLTTNPIAGAILDSAGGWLGVKIFSGIFCIVGTFFVLGSRVQKTGWNLLAVF